MKVFFRISALILLLTSSGCIDHFLQMEQLNELSANSSPENSIIYFEKQFILTNAQELYHETHFIYKAVNKDNSIPDYLSVFNSPNMNMNEYEARIIRKDETQFKYTKDDLIWRNLSSRNLISELAIGIIPINERISDGGLLEQYYSHYQLLSQLGINFSLEELPSSADQIKIIFITQSGSDLMYKSVNGLPEPTIVNNEHSKQYVFKVNGYTAIPNRTEFSKKNSAPGLLVSTVSNQNRESNWKIFGDWYLDLIKSKTDYNEDIKKTALEITCGLNTPKEKIDAIFNFCQQNIRYEQVYLDHGEFIPNDCHATLSRQYGDCKDYSILMYCLAKSIGIELDLALCWRGRGVEFHEEIPVNQFNHMIVHYEEAGNHFWYDGTNRLGIPGMTTFDLANQKALILKDSDSQLLKIQECDSNLVLITGDLFATNNNLNGNLKIELFNQFAIDFKFLDFIKNKSVMAEEISKWISKNLNGSLILKKLVWTSKGNRFIIELDCELPNTIIFSGTSYQTNIYKIFPHLIPQTLPTINELFYFPNYNRTKIDLRINSGVGSDTPNLNPVTFAYSINLGPFSDEEKNNFISSYSNLIEKFKTPIKFTEGH